ncbi:MAG TPA: menaquinone biosynthesis decarboxylase [Spirochaetia bacterium]|nr:menaquinone biosynthesis decarboxylase [Spirochaetia bacterium]
MAYKDLPEFISALEQRHELKRISCEVERNLEITEITDRVVKASGPALLFERVAGSPYPLLINSFGSPARVALALGVTSVDEIAARIAELIDLGGYAGMMDRLRALPKLAELARFFPHEVKRAACQQVVEREPDLSLLPVLRCWPGDGGPFFTLPLVITRDPDTGVQNMGMYRLQVFDNRTTGMHWHLHKDGREIWEKYRARGGRMPVAVAVGCDPATVYSATAPLPKSIDELLFSGFLRRAPVETVRCVSSELRVPANAEFILEGYVDTNEQLRREGPFGDHTGYYSLVDLYPVFHVETITRKHNPIFHATVVGKPPMEDCYLGKATERIFLPLIKMQLPEIVDLNFPLEGVFHNCVIVSIHKRYPGHARKVMHAIWGMGQMMYTKMVVVVDQNVDPQDLSTVAWKVFNNIDPARDLEIVTGPLDALDHASPLPHFGHKLGVDATKKLPAEGHAREWPDDIVMNREIRERVDARWNEYGF